MRKVTRTVRHILWNIEARCRIVPYLDGLSIRRDPRYQPRAQTTTDQCRPSKSCALDQLQDLVRSHWVSDTWSSSYLNDKLR